MHAVANAMVAAMQTIVSDYEYLGCETAMYCDTPDARIVVRLDHQIRLRRGDSVDLDVAEKAIHLFNRVSGERVQTKANW